MTVLNVLIIMPKTALRNVLIIMLKQCADYFVEAMC